MSDMRAGGGCSRARSLVGVGRILLWMRPLSVVVAAAVLYVTDRFSSSLAVPAEFYLGSAAWLLVALPLDYARVRSAAPQPWDRASVVVDMLTSVYLFHVLEGVGWLGFVPFMVVAVSWPLVVSGRLSVLFASGAGAGIVAVALLEANGWLPHHAWFATDVGDRYRDPAYIIATLAIVVVASSRVIVTMQFVARQLWLHRRALEAANDEVTRSQRELAEQNEILQRQVIGQIDKLTTLSEISRITNSSLDIHEVEVSFARELRHLIDFDALVLEVPGESRSLRFFHASGPDEVTIEARVRQQVKQGTLTYAVMTAGRSVLVRDAETEYVWTSKDRVREGGICSLASVPLFASGRIIGAFTVCSKQAAAYDNDDVLLLERVAESLGLAIEHAKLYEDAARLAQQETTLGKIGRVLNSGQQLSRVYDEVLAHLTEVCPADEAVIAVLESGGVTSYTRRAGLNDVGHVRYGDDLLRAETAASLVRDFDSDGTSPLDRALLDRGYHSAARFPIIIRSVWSGILMLNARERAAFSQTDKRLIDEVGHLLAAAIETARLYEEMRRYAETDPLTGLLNRRSMTTVLEREFIRWRQAGPGFALLVLDVDEFKLANDKLGHGFGDTVLRDVGRLLAEAARQEDTVARVGGDEFYLILPGTDVDGAAALAERIRDHVAGAELHREELGAMVSVSIGVAVCPTHADSVEDLLRMADAAMYEAKRAGRNRVVVSSARRREVA